MRHICDLRRIEIFGKTHQRSTRRPHLRIFSIGNGGSVSQLFEFRRQIKRTARRRKAVSSCGELNPSNFVSIRLSRA